MENVTVLFNGTEGELVTRTPIEGPETYPENSLSNSSTVLGSTSEVDNTSDLLNASLTPALETDIFPTTDLFI